MSVEETRKDEDVDMTKDEVAIETAQPIQEVEEEEQEEEQDNDLDNEKIKILLQGASEDGCSASFEIVDEDHTVGNPLRYIIMKNPQVEFCGYSIPHPSEDLLHIRIQTYGEITAVEALKKGLSDLMDLCDVVEEKFTQKIRDI